LVVPRSMPMILAMSVFLVRRPLLIATAGARVVDVVEMGVGGVDSSGER